MKFHRLLFAFAATLTSITGISMQANAQEVTWKQVSFSGPILGYCNSNRLQTLFTGNDAAFLFNDFAINFKPYASINFYLPLNCTTRTKVTIPKGYTISSIFGNAAGGVIKDAGIQASLTTRMFLLNTGTNTTYLTRNTPNFLVGSVNFAINQPAAEPIVEVAVQTDLTAQEKAKMCASTKKADFSLDISQRYELGAIRMNPRAALFLEMNSNDVRLLLDQCPI